MEGFNIVQVLNFLQAIAWPVTILTLFYYFASPLKSLLSAITVAVNERGVKLTAGGIEISQPQLDENVVEPIKEPHYYQMIAQQSKAETVKTDIIEGDTPTNVEEALEKHERKLVTDISGEIEKFLSNKSLKDEDQEILKGLLCDAYINLYFERAYQKILGSQIRLMQRLRDNKEGYFDEDYVEKFFQEYRASDKITFDLWVSFLERSRFVKRKNNKVTLRDEGKEFLSYIVDRNYPLGKAG